MERLRVTDPRSKATARLGRGFMKRIRAACGNFSVDALHYWPLDIRVQFE
jgi:hypothetical protein